MYDIRGTRKLSVKRRLFIVSVFENHSLKTTSSKSSAEKPFLEWIKLFVWGVARPKVREGRAPQKFFFCCIICVASDNYD